MITNRSLISVACMLAYLILVSCAAPMSDSPGLSQFSDYTYVTTSPDKLRCEYLGQNTTKTSETNPHFIDLNRLSTPIKIVCSKLGYWDSSVVIEPILDTSLFDRLLVAKQNITLATVGYSKADIGPLHRLPRKVHIVLRRNFFQNIKERDSYYAEENAFTQKSWNHWWSTLDVLCKTNIPLEKNSRPYINNKSCNKAKKQIQQLLRNDLMSIELQRRRSSIK